MTVSAVRYNNVEHMQIVQLIDKVSPTDSQLIVYNCKNKMEETLSSVKSLVCTVVGSMLYAF
jgi:hypothetical protein